MAITVRALDSDVVVDRFLRLRRRQRRRVPAGGHEGLGAVAVDASPDRRREAPTTGRGHRSFQDRRRVPTLPVAGSRTVPVNAAQLRARRGTVPGRAISQQDSELYDATRNARHRIRYASCTSVESGTGRVDGDGASVFLSLSAAQRSNRDRSCWLRPHGTQLVAFRTSEVSACCHGGTYAEVLRSKRR